MTENPYESPETEPPVTELPTLGVIARPIFLSWEMLRLVYNVVLVAVVVLAAAPASLWFEEEFWKTAIAGAVGANVCFMAGPVAETYLAWLGMRTIAVRIVLFSLGTLASCALAAVSIRLANQPF